MNFDDEMAGLVDEGRAADIVCLEFSMAFANISQEILIDKLLMYAGCMRRQWGGLKTYRMAGSTA